MLDFKVLLLVFFMCFNGCVSIPLKDFYPFGSSHGDQHVPSNDDGSSPKITISTLFPYFNQQFSSLYVNTNGAISFSKTLSSYTPSSFPLTGNRKIVAPFWCDIDTRNGGVVWFYETIDQAILYRASDEVKKVFPEQANFDATWVFVATWENVSFYGASTTGKRQRNTFQCILITNGRHSFTIFLYNKIQWTTGTASQGSSTTGLGGTPAQVGFDAGDGYNFKAIHESRTPAVVNVATLSNVNIPGKFIYRIDTETVKDGGCSSNTGGTLTIFPRYGTMFGGTRLSVGGPCLKKDDKIFIKFIRVPSKVPCSMLSLFTVRCVTPMVYRTGTENVTLYLTHGNGNTSLFTGYYTYVNPATTKTHISRVDAERWKLGENVTIRWGSLPFEADYLAVEQLHLKNVNKRPVLKSEGYIGRRIRSYENSHSFVLNSYGQAAVLRIHEDPEDAKDTLRKTPSAWSDVFVVKPNNSILITSVCDSWDAADQNYLPIDTKAIDVCPCTITQARLDISRFNPDPTCNTIDKSKDSDGDFSSNCLYQQGALRCLRMAFASQSGHDNQCCYNKEGQLIETNSNRFGGMAHRFHYKGGSDGNIPCLSNIQNDIVPYMYCCQYVLDYDHLSDDYCVRYLTRRPPSRCKGYTPPRLASTRGDPHLVTLDGIPYTFNGIGEFTLLQSDDGNLVLQARMEQFKDNRGSAKQASVITSVAFRCNKTSDVLEVRLNQIRLCDILINGQLLDLENTNTIDLKGSTILTSKGNDTTVESIWTLITCKTPTVALNVTTMAKMININVVIAGVDLRGHVHGLLGNFNGRKDDDFTTASGIVVPINSSLDIIHHQFGLKWLTGASYSLFTYPIGKTHNTYQQISFQPIFHLPSHCPADVADVCGDDDACRFDFCTTDDTSVAISTRTMTAEIEEMSEVALPVCGIPGNISNGYWNFTGQLANLICNTDYIANGSTTILCGDNGVWEVTDTTCDLTPCGEITDVLHGYWNRSDRIAKLVCNDNYEPREYIHIQCHNNGIWYIPDKSNDTCQIIACGEITDVMYGYWNRSKKTANLVCNDNYEAKEPIHIQCYNNGSWSVPDQANNTCKIVACGEITEVMYGYWNRSERTANLVCNDNFEAKESVYIQCYTNGSWNVPDQANDTCKIIACGEITEVMYGYWNRSKRTANLVCNDNYEAKESIYIQCYNNGSWNVTDQGNDTCKIKECELPPIVMNGKWHLNGQSVQLVCDDMYSLNGSEFIRCSNDGRWGVITSSCISKDPSNGLITDKKGWMKIVLPITSVLTVIVVVVVIVRYKNKTKDDNTDYALVKKRHDESVNGKAVYYNTSF